VAKLISAVSVSPSCGGANLTSLSMERFALYSHCVGAVRLDLGGAFWEVGLNQVVRIWIPVQKLGGHLHRLRPTTDGSVDRRPVIIQSSLKGQGIANIGKRVCTRPTFRCQWAQVRTRYQTAGAESEVPPILRSANSTCLLTCTLRTELLRRDAL
jgi:hypothetical protein